MRPRMLVEGNFKLWHSIPDFSSRKQLPGSFPEEGLTPFRLRARG